MYYILHMRHIPTIGILKKRALITWLFLSCLIVGQQVAQAQESMSEYALGSPLLITDKKEVLVEKLIFRHRLQPGQAAIQIRNCENISVKNCAFIGIGAAIQVSGSKNISVENCAFVDLFESGSSGVVPQIGLETYQVQGLFVEDCLFEFVSTGLYAADSEDVTFKKNAIFNVLGPYPRGQAVQFARVSGTKNLISENYILNESEISAPQDCINLFKSFGTKDYPIRVENNLILGDPTKGNLNQSPSGSGIMAGDGGGAFQLIRKNQLDSPGQVGIGVAGGDQIEIVENVVRGDVTKYSNVGISVWSQYPTASGKVMVMSNIIGWRNKDSRLNNNWQGKAKFGPKWEFSSVEWKDNQEVFPEDLQIHAQPSVLGWLLAEGAKYSILMKKRGGTPQQLFDGKPN
jgi:hypothetical protein